MIFTLIYAALFSRIWVFPSHTSLTDTDFGSYIVGGTNGKLKIHPLREAFFKFIFR